MPWSSVCLPSHLAAQNPSKFSTKKWRLINDTRLAASDISTYFNDMRQARTLKHMKWMIQALREPSTQNSNLFCVPLLEKVQNPKIIVNLTANQVDVIPSKINVALAELFPGARNILKRERACFKISRRNNLCNLPWSSVMIQSSFLHRISPACRASPQGPTRACWWVLESSTRELYRFGHRSLRGIDA